MYRTVPEESHKYTPYLLGPHIYLINSNQKLNQNIPKNHQGHLHQVNSLDLIMRGRFYAQIYNIIELVMSLFKSLIEISWIIIQENSIITQ